MTKPNSIGKIVQKDSVVDVESCQNPFWKPHTHSKRIVVYITDEQLPICETCWTAINDHRREVLYQWGKEDQKLMMMIDWAYFQKA